MSEPGPTSKSGLRSLAIRLLVLAGIVAGIAALIYTVGGSLTLESLAARETQLRQFHAAHPAATLAVAFLVYAAVTGLSIPGATPMSLVYGWVFGFGTAVVLVSFASTTGASIAFLMSRYLIGSWVQSRFAERLEAFNRAIEKEGAWYLFTLRLVPVVPFFVINVVMGLTKIRLTTFWWVSQIGMLPATCIFVWAGASAPSLTAIQEKGVGSILSLNVILALAALGLFPLTVRWTLKLFTGEGGGGGG
ncbi:MAG: TVP38/TMEM64 family protein, partial [Pirellulaceae bacterium]|nr:TVP38/TMEM64 family protein [Pirellulaceae bacterium]